LGFAANRPCPGKMTPEGEQVLGVFERIRVRRTAASVPAVVDSRQYIIPFRIDSPDDVPFDFRTGGRPEFRNALFLPRSDPDWFGRSTSPPRILFLTDSMVTVMAHPADGGSEQRISLSEIQELETGNMLLLGWLQVRADEDRVQHPPLPAHRQLHTPTAP